MTAPRRSRNWIWYFAILVVLTAASLTTLFVFNQGQQLRLEQLTQAESLWMNKGPRSYDLEYTQVGATPGVFKVRVRNGKVISAARNGQPLEKRLLPYYDMKAIFGYIEDFLKSDAEPGRPRTFTKAIFDEQDGHLKHYTRKVAGTREQIEITVNSITPSDADKTYFQQDQPLIPTRLYGL